MKPMLIGNNIIHKDELTSTNTFALGLLATGRPPEGTIVSTFNQTAGRGQPGNKWESEKGKNLSFSIILYPNSISPDSQFIVSMAISVGINDFIAEKVPGGTIKWPNDIYMKDDKIAGLLIESSTMGNKVLYMVAGIGLNVNQVEFRSEATNPVSLKQLTGVEYDLNECLLELAASIDYRYGQLSQGKLNLIRSEYHKQLYRIGKWAAFSDSSGKFKGSIRSVSDDGMLTIEKESGKTGYYYFKEVEFIF